MSYSIAIMSASGGAGRSTVSHYLARALAKQTGQQALVVKFDGNSNLKNNPHGLTEYLAGQAELQNCVVNIEENFDCLPMGCLNPVEYPIFAKRFNQSKISSMVDSLSHDYSWIIFDTPAGTGQLTQAILHSSMFCIPLVTAKPSELPSFWTVLSLVKHWQQSDESGLRQLLGILPTRVNHQCPVSRAAMSEIWSEVSGLFEVMIADSTAFEQAILNEESGLVPGKSREMQRFQLLAIEVQNRIEFLMKELGHESGQLVTTNALTTQLV